MTNSSLVFAPPSSLLTVSELTRKVRSNLEHNFSSLWVEGEVSNLACPSSGHRYFTLKDQTSQIRAVLFRSQGERLKFALRDGLEVLVFAHLTVYAPRGDYQLQVEAVTPKGIGELQLAYIQLKAKLEAENIFEASRKRKLPPYPQRIGLVTSPKGAAIHDLLTILNRRWPLANILLAPVAVQGHGAPGKISSAIRMLNEVENVDVIIVGRGGGSLEDLWAFNDEGVVRTIAASKIPIVSAVGHESDMTLADLAADQRAPTPSAAAELVVPDCIAVGQDLEHYRARLRRSIIGNMAALTARTQVLCRRLPEPRLVIGQFIQRIDDMERQLYIRLKDVCQNLHILLLRHQSVIREANPLVGIRQKKRLIADLGERLVRGMKGSIIEKRYSMELPASQLHQLSPLAVLGRGYSIVQTVKSGKILKKSSEVLVGETIRAILHEGELVCLVQKTEREGGEIGF